MENLNKFFVYSVVSCFFMLPAGAALAGVATEYDEINLTTYQSGDDIFGYYLAHDDMFSCGFFFMSNSSVGVKSADGTRVLPLNTFDFVPHKNQFSYEQRDRRAEIGGTLYLHGKELALKTAKPHGGCLSAAGIFNASPGERGANQYTAIKTFDAIGIAVATRKSFFYKKSGLGRQKQYLVAGDIVTLISRRNGYSYVRFVNPDMSIDEDDPRKVTFGWLRDDDLADPFPRSPIPELPGQKNTDREKRD